jgi:hypothetical protein
MTAKGRETPMTTPTRERSTMFSTLFGTLVGLASLAILLQAVWAGIFIRQGGAYDGFWVTVHARGAEVTIALALAVWLPFRARRGSDPGV